MAIRLLTILPIVILILGGFAYLITRATKRTSIEVMLLGIGISIVGGIVAIDPNSDLGGIEYLVVFFGLVLQVVGFIKGEISK